MFIEGFSVVKPEIYRTSNGLPALHHIEVICARHPGGVSVRYKSMSSNARKGLVRVFGCRREVYNQKRPQEIYSVGDVDG